MLIPEKVKSTEINYILPFLNISSNSIKHIPIIIIEHNILIRICIIK